MSGHVHQPSAELVTTQTGQYIASTSGTLSSRLRSHPASFNRVCICEKTIDVEIYNIDEGKVALRSEEHFSRLNR